MSAFLSILAAACSLIMIALTLALRSRMGMVAAWPMIVAGLVAGLANHAVDLAPPSPEPRPLMEVVEGVYLPALGTIFLGLGVTLHLLGLARAGKLEQPSARDLRAARARP